MPPHPILDIPVAKVIATLAAEEDGQSMATVLKSLSAELGNAKVLHVTKTKRHVTLKLPSGKLASVRITFGKRSHPTTKKPTFRFKRPRNLEQYSVIYFGGLTDDGSIWVQPLRPSEIGALKTITIQSDA